MRVATVVVGRGLVVVVVEAVRAVHQFVDGERRRHRQTRQATGSCGEVRAVQLVVRVHLNAAKIRVEEETVRWRRNKEASRWINYVDVIYVSYFCWEILPSLVAKTNDQGLHDGLITYTFAALFFMESTNFSVNIADILLEKLKAYKILGVFLHARKVPYQDDRRTFLCSMS